jgi:hypothetical protein
VTDIGKMISQLEQQRGAIDRAISALREVEGPKPARSTPADDTDANRPKKRRMSAAGRRRIGEATRKRWADKRAAEALQSKNSPATKKATGPRKAGRKRAFVKKAASAAAS